MATSRRRARHSADALLRRRQRNTTLSLIVSIALLLASPAITPASSSPLPAPPHEVAARNLPRRLEAGSGLAHDDSTIKFETRHDQHIHQHSRRTNLEDDPYPTLELDNAKDHMMFGHTKTRPRESFITIVNEIVGSVIPHNPSNNPIPNNTLAYIPPEGPVFTVTWAKRSVPDGYTELIRTYTAGYVVLSYFIAVIGSACTLELLLRRTSNRGWSNLLLLVAAGVCFGSVSTFSMHFIGNNSLSLSRPPMPGHTYSTYSLSYAAGWTILSLMVSCVAMILAFAVMGLDIDWRKWVRALGMGRLVDKDMETPTSGSSGSFDLAKHENKLASLSSADDSVGGKKAVPTKQDQKKMKNLEMRTKIDSVMEKLEWALSWSMVDMPKGLRRSSKARSEEAEERARKKNLELSRPELESRKLSWRKSDHENSEALRKWSQMAEEEGDFRKSGEGDVIDLTLPSSSRGRSSLDGDLPLATMRLPSSVASSSADRPVLPVVWTGGESLFPIQATPDDSATTFAPGFSFPPMSPSSAPAGIPLPSSPERSKTLLYPPSPVVTVKSSTWASNVAANRRASLPFTGGFSKEEYVPPTYNLARIQSSTSQDYEEDTPEFIERERAAEEQRKAKAAKAEIVEKALQDARAQSATVPESGNIGGPTSPRFDGSQPEEDDLDNFRTKPVEKKPASKLKKWLGLDIVTQAEVIKIIITGCMAGSGVAGMHYIGQRSIISIPYISYNIGSIIAAVVIACIAVSAALYILFIILRPKLQHGWLVKIGVAMFLAAAVCAMHYTGMAGATYGLVVDEPAPESAKVAASTTRAITGTVAALACAACLGVIAFLITAQIRTVAQRKGRRRVVIATMLYDQDNRLLVGTDGVLPMSDIASVRDGGKSKRLSRTRSTKTWDSESSSSSVLDVDLTTGHPAFIAALRSTWAWRQTGSSPATASTSKVSTDGSETVVDGSSTVDINLSDQHYPESLRRGSTISNVESASYPQLIGHPAALPQNVSKFLERFSAAVSVLAAQVTGSAVAVRRLGVLYDRILTTGHVVINSSDKNADPRNKVTVSKGQLVFLVRKLDSVAERNQLLARGFMFAEPMAVAAVMSKVLAVPVDNISEILRDQMVFCQRGMTSGIKPGRLYAGIFMIQPTPFDGIHIWTGQNRHSLPMRELCTLSNSSFAVRSQATDKSNSLVGTTWEIQDALAQLANQSLFDLIAACSTKVGDPSVKEDSMVVQLRSTLVNTLIPMLDLSLPSKAMTKLLPKLRLRPMLIPLMPPTPSIKSIGSESAWLIIFKAVVHADADTSTVDWENWALFRAQNACVMQEGRDALSAARLAIANAALNIEPEYNRARRPSKIQWGTDPLTLDDSIPPSPAARPELKTPPIFSPTFTAGYSLQAEATSQTPRGVSPAPAVRTARGPPDLSIMLPRRSSLLRAHSGEPSSPMGGASAFSGTSSQFSTYDKDWLLKLLQEDLYEPQDDDE